jgi:hypothetical protein
MDSSVSGLGTALGFCENYNDGSKRIKSEESVDQLSNYNFLKKNSVPSQARNN